MDNICPEGLLGDVFGAVGGNFFGNNDEKNDDVVSNNMSVDSNFTMGEGEPDWLFSPNKIRN